MPNRRNTDHRKKNGPAPNLLFCLYCAILLSWPSVLGAQGSSRFVLPGYEGLPVDGGGSWFALLHDLNGDDQPDLYVGRSFQRDQVFLNNGQGQFRELPDTARWHTLGGSFDGLFIDLNADGLDDLVLARGPESGGTNRLPGRDQILINRGDGRFVERSANLPAGALLPGFGGVDTLNFSMGVAAGDFNRDGIVDLAFANGGVSYLIKLGLYPALDVRYSADLLSNDLYFGRGDTDGDTVINFRDVSDSSGFGLIPDLSTDLVVADFNGDGFDDIAVCCYYDLFMQILLQLSLDSYYTKLYLNDSSNPGQFTLQSNAFPLERFGATSISAADVDGDKDIDVFITVDNRARGAMMTATGRLFLNNGQGVFSEATDSLLPPYGEFERVTFDGILVDVNNDELVDIFGAGEHSFLFVQTPQGRFADSTHTLPTHRAGGITHKFHTYGAAAADVNGDELTDIVLANTFEQNRLHLQLPGMRFVDTTSFNLPPDGENNVDVAIGDLNGDDRPDILALGPSRPHTRCLYLNTGNAADGYARFRDISDRLPVETVFHYGAAIADINGDGRQDVMITGYQGGRLFYNAGNDADGIPHFADSTARWLPEFMTSALFNKARFADLNNDSHPDIVIPAGHVDNQDNTPEPNRIFVWNPDSRAYENRNAWLPDNNARSLTVDVMDINTDGWPDLVFANRNAPLALYYSTAEPDAPDPGYRKQELDPQQRFFAAAFGRFGSAARPGIVALAVERQHFDRILLNTRPDAVTPLFEARNLAAGANGLRNRALALFDVDGSGFTDIVISGRDGSRVYLDDNGTVAFSDRSADYFGEDVLFNDATSTYGMAAHDMNGDGLTDVYFARDNQDWLFYGFNATVGIEPDKSGADNNGVFTVLPQPSDGRPEFRLHLENVAAIALEVYDFTGRPAARLPSRTLPAGLHSLMLPAAIGRLPAGVYIARLRIGPRYVQQVFLVTP